MYADQIEAQSNRSVKDRLDGNSGLYSGRLRSPVRGKRQREDDDKWEHDLFEDSRLGAKDLRLKLQRKNIGRTTLRGSVVGGARDLREKLSGTLYSRPSESEPLSMRLKPTTEGAKSPGKSAFVKSHVPESNKNSNTVSKKKTQQKVASVDNFLQSLDLEKYSITFQAEEVDMTALLHMSDEDLKALGIPMGPRKKILLALEAKA